MLVDRAPTPGEMNAVGMNVLSFESDPTDVWEAGDQVIEVGPVRPQWTRPGAQRVNGAMAISNVSPEGVTIW